MPVTKRSKPSPRVATLGPNRPFCYVRRCTIGAVTQGYTLSLLGPFPDQGAGPSPRGHRDDDFQFVAVEREWSPLFGSGRIWKRRRLDVQNKFVSLGYICAKMGI